MKYFGSFIFIAILFLAAVESHAACSCADSRTVQDEFTASPIVATATLTSFDELDRIVEGSNVYRTVAAVMTIETVYKGNVRTNQTIRILDGGGGECSRSFVREKIGQKFLFFTGPPTKVGNLKGLLHWISTCSRSARIEEAAPDLNYLDNRAMLTGKTRLSGSIKRFSPDPPSLSGLKVTVTGPNFERTAETNERGFFELWNLPPGKYKVAFIVPARLRVAAYMFTGKDRQWRREELPDNSVQAIVAARKHVELTVALDSNSSSGR
jgi:hypothetical protein